MNATKTTFWKILVNGAQEAGDWTLEEIQALEAQGYKVHQVRATVWVTGSTRNASRHKRQAQEAGEAAGLTYQEEASWQALLEA